MDTHLKALLVKSPLHFLLLELRSRYEYSAVELLYKFRPTARKTAYVISPYKTGTTYLKGLFHYTCRVAHEPLHYTTLRHIDNIDFLSKRARFLNLDIECSGFFADKLHVVRKFAPTAPVLMLSRSPEDWIASTINYFRTLAKSIYYNYVARLFFDPICGDHIEDFYKLNQDKQANIVRSLLEFWINIYKEAKADPNTLIIPLLDIDHNIKRIEQFLGHKSRPVTDRKWIRANPKKLPFCLRDYIDLNPYQDDIEALQR